jgi:uncharacterized membrane protein YczE
MTLRRVRLPRRSPIRDWAQLLLGLAVYGVAIALMIRANLGLGPWDAFHVGIHLLTGMSIGTASIVVGLVIVAGTWATGRRPGPGTLANMVLIGIFIDLILPIVPDAPNAFVGFPMLIAGIVLSGFATGLYIGARLGKGPRDGLMIAVSESTNWPVGRVRTLLELSVLLAGWLMGGAVGIGTILFTFGIGSATQWGLMLFGFSATGTEEPRPLRKAA